jgi:hypothetical protein
VKGTRPGHLPPPSRTTERERVCAEPGCETKLSIYNDSELCWQHEDVTFPNFRGKRLAPRKG